MLHAGYTRRKKNGVLERPEWAAQQASRVEVIKQRVEIAERAACEKSGRPYPEYVTRTCIHCGEPFECVERPGNNRRRTCSNDCKMKTRKRKSGEGKETTGCTAEPATAADTNTCTASASDVPTASCTGQLHRPALTPAGPRWRRCTRTGSTTPGSTNCTAT